MSLSRKFHIMLHMAACQPCTLSALAHQVRDQYGFASDPEYKECPNPTIVHVLNVTAVDVAELCRDGYMERYDGVSDAFDLTNKGWEWSGKYPSTSEGWEAGNKELTQ